MRRLWFGGSFNPIHFGHLISARAVAEAAGFDQVVLVPNRQPPHKPEDASLMHAGDRAAMCRLAVRGDPLFEVDEIELGREGPSYTIDTALQLKARGETDIYWLIGADMTVSLPRWHESSRLLAEVNFVLMARPGWAVDWETLPTELQKLKSNVVATPQLDISSTMIRRRLAEGRSPRYLTPDAVSDYIQQRQLYSVR